MNLLSVVRLSERLDWGFGNSNATGAFIAILLVAVWAVPALVPSGRVGGGKGLTVFLFVLREFLWFGALGMSLFWGYKELQTGSRGGAVAAVAGLMAVASFSVVRWRQYRWWRVVAVVLAIAGMVFVAARTHPAERLAPGYSVGDASIGNRLKIWKWTPAMIADAPGGWGWKRSPKSFMDWYQDDDHRETYTALVNTHLEWLVEFNWLGRIGYLLAWALVFRLLWPSRVRRFVNAGQVYPLSRRAEREAPLIPPSQKTAKSAPEDRLKTCPSLSALQRFSAAAFGTWVALAVGAFFSTVANEWALWPVPVFLLLAVLGTRWQQRCWPSLKNLFFSVAVPVSAVMLILLVAGFATSPMSVREQGARVRIGAGVPRVVLFAGANANETPRQLRTIWRTSPGAPTVHWVSTGRASDVAGKIGTLVLLGEVEVREAQELVARAERVLVFGLRFAPESVFDANTLPKVQAYVGEFSSSSYLDAWKATGRCVNVEGDGDFIGDWVTRSFEIAKEEGNFHVQAGTGETQTQKL